ncbi:MAG: secretion protein [Blastopirellula sp.]|nr:MAG: secretion protein [Blastopirellula sp.]
MHLDQVAQSITALTRTEASYAQQVVGIILDAAIDLHASDIHLQPTEEGHLLKYRIDGVLNACTEIIRGETSDIIARLKVLAGLLTYRNDVPQEGRIRNSEVACEMRVSTFPALYGERVVVRVFREGKNYLTLNDLGLATEVENDLTHMLRETSGLILITGPAGSGKSTTSYACLRHLVETTQGSRSLVSLEDPIEVVVPGVAQSQVNQTKEFNFATGLRSLMRQDPEVILIGEIRDQVTAEVAMQSSLTGQLVISTFHSGSAAQSISRLIEMGIPPYMLHNSLLGVLHQRLARKLCKCSVLADQETDLGFEIEGSQQAQGCENCNGTGYHGRVLLSEWLVPNQHGMNGNNIQLTDTASIEQAAVEAGMKTRWDHAAELIRSGTTSELEIRRVLGFRS